MKVHVNIRTEKGAKRQDFCASPGMQEGCPVPPPLGCSALIVLVRIKEARWARMEHCAGVTKSWHTHVFSSYL